MYYLYVLKSRIAAKSYVGITSNLKRRIEEHNRGKSFYTSRYKPWDIIYTEDIKSLVDARKREKYLKSASGRKFLKKEIFKN